MAVNERYEMPPNTSERSSKGAIRGMNAPANPAQNRLATLGASRSPQD